MMKVNDLGQSLTSSPKTQVLKEYIYIPIKRQQIQVITKASIQGFPKYHPGVNQTIEFHGCFWLGKGSTFILGFAYP